MTEQINLDAVGQELEPMVYEYGTRDVILYHLGLGMGRDQLPFTYERSLRVLPSFAVVPPFPAMSGCVSMLKANPMMILHGEQAFELHRPIPVSGKLTTSGRIEGIYDKGKGASVVLRTDTVDDRDRQLFSNRFTLFVRGAGGFGGEAGPREPVREMPDRAPDQVLETPTREDQALLYRLSGDYNPLHADPEFAKLAGFDTPILHGLCTYGIACWGVLEACAEMQPERMKSFQGRFSSPVFPGETLVTEIWADGDEALFQTRVKERDVVALTRGHARFAD
ncbi:MAG TPA: MaoC/PaaZ C-terminal domain-containing protein [Gammaproteobacteria bacterium]|nr:MaoC/PaaZ C-terminal domain-containing protein [Gammaproteobacteria bacterium]